MSDKVEIDLDEIEDQRVFDEDDVISPAQFDQVDLRKALREQPEIFMHFFLADKLTLAVPDFHIEIFFYLITFAFERFALAVPRGHSKTTLVKLAICWYFIFSDIRFIVYCSNTTLVAKDEVRDIINMLRCDNFKALFGSIKWVKQNESEGLYIFEIEQSQGKWKRCILKALGAGQQVRGLNIDHQRPQLLVCDDAEDDENTETETQRKKFKKWVYGPLFKACARFSKKIWIGNLVSQFCLIGKFCESEFWHSIKYGCIKDDGTPLWPEMFDIEYLRKDFREYQQEGMVAKWYAEMMNMPMPDGMGLISADEINYRPSREPGDIEFGFVTLDPAISKKASADNTALAVHGYCDDKYQIVEHYKGKLDPIQQLHMAVDLCYKWHVTTVGIETASFQASMISLWKFVQVERGAWDINVVELLHGGTRKTERITGWASWLRTHNYALNEGEFEITQQLLQYDPSKVGNDDDLIDACAYGPQMITEHLNLIMQDNNKPKPEIKTLAQVSDV